MVKQILFVCKHNIFRSRIAEEFFKVLNKNKNYRASSAGIIKWNNKDLKGDTGFDSEKRVAKEFGINLKVKSRGLDSSILKTTDTLIVVADDVSLEIFRDKSFKGKLIVWKVSDVKQRDKKKDIIARNAVEEIEKRIKNLVGRLK